MLVDRDHIGLFGKMNSGKSTLINLLTQQETSITDSTPGTTADTKVAMQEIHGLGPAKLYDTAGLDETSLLGEKKRLKVLNALKECDLILLVIDPSTTVFTTEKLILEECKEKDKQLLVVYNLFNASDAKRITIIEDLLPELQKYGSIEFSFIDTTQRQKLLQFILDNYSSKNNPMELLPFVEKDEFYILNIPMDEETPPGRYLRPQAMAEEYITRHWAYPISYRMNLGVARSNNPQPEKDRFLSFLQSLNKQPKAIITDSQAMDIMAQWAPESIKLTTFSIMMINFVSKGRINDFYEGIKAMNHLKPNDKILIAEACNHSRIKEDIGTVQIPNIIKKNYPGVMVDFNFGREFQDNKELSNYKLIIHCGGCMISNQKMNARLNELRKAGVPITNYGIFLSWMQGQKALNRVMEPWRKE
jgi:[FeFe] hydrogenase H-cluster maturation GTPase HydF